MKDILFWGCMYPRDEVDEIRKNSTAGIQNAADILQWDYIDGIEENLGHPIQLLTRMSVGIFPMRYKKAFIRGHSFHHKPGADDYAVGFLNTVPVRPFFYKNIGFKHLAKWARRGNQEKKILIAYSYNMTPTLVKFKKRFPDIKTVLILLDLPRFTDMAHTGSRLYQYKHEKEEKCLREAVRQTDGLVTITRQMRDELDPEHKKKAVVIEGMAKTREIIPCEKNPVFTIAYTGTLTRAYGVLDLVEAVRSIEDRPIRLVICGQGETEAELREISKQDSRIEYRGSVSAEKAAMIQQEADLLVNPRKNEGEFTRFSFPSKILQYMSSGTPVLCYRLDGMGPEYDDFLYYIKDKESLKNAIVRVYSYEEDKRVDAGAKAAYFINQVKSVGVQTKFLLKLIEKI